MGVEENGVVKEGDMRDVSKFLNRLLGLKLLKQNMVSSWKIYNQKFSCDTAV